MAATADVRHLDYYLFRNDQDHLRLEDQSRGIFEVLGNRFHLAPVIQPSKIADIGCGTGVVTSFFGSTYPNAEVVGIDLDLDPGRHKAPNVSYVEGNIEKLVNEHPQIQGASFDFVYSRLLVFGLKNWPERVKDIAKMLKPGGYYECQEAAPMFWKDDHIMEDQPRWANALHEASIGAGLDFKIQLNISRYMEQAGLEVVRKVVYKWPIGHWLEKDQPQTTTLGRLSLKELHAVIQKVCENLLGGLRTSSEVDEIKADIAKTMVNSPGVYFAFVVTIGRKPL